MYVYIQSEANLWTTGSYDPDGKWVPESDHGSASDAAARARLLNGGDVEEHRTVGEWKNYNQRPNILKWVDDVVGAPIRPLSRKDRDALIRAGQEVIQAGGLRGDICDRWKTMYTVEGLIDRLDYRKLFF